MKNNSGLIFYILSMVIVVIICGLLAYLISTSDLPEWFKFWLLK